MHKMFLLVLLATLFFGRASEASSSQTPEAYCEAVRTSQISKKLTTQYSRAKQSIKSLVDLQTKLKPIDEYLTSKGKSFPNIYQRSLTSIPKKMLTELSRQIESSKKNFDEITTLGIEDGSGAVSNATIQILAKAAGISNEISATNATKAIQFGEQILPRYSDWFFECATHLKASTALYIFVSPSKENGFLGGKINKTQFRNGIIGSPNFDPFQSRINPKWVTPLFFIMGQQSSQKITEKINFGRISEKVSAIVSINEQFLENYQNERKRLLNLIAAADKNFAEAKEKYKQDQIKLAQRRASQKAEAEKNKKIEEAEAKKRDAAFKASRLELEKYANSPSGKLDFTYRNYQIVSHCHDIRSDKAAQFISRKEFDRVKSAMREIEEKLSLDIGETEKKELWNKANMALQNYNWLSTKLNLFDVLIAWNKNVRQFTSAKEICDSFYLNFLKKEKEILGTKVLKKDF